MRIFRVTNMDDENYSFMDFSWQLGDCAPFNEALKELRTMPNSELTELKRWTDDNGVIREGELLLVDRKNGREKWAREQMRRRI